MGLGFDINGMKSANRRIVSSTRNKSDGTGTDIYAPHRPLDSRDQAPPLYAPGVASKSYGNAFDSIAQELKYRQTMNDTNDYSDAYGTANNGSLNLINAKAAAPVIGKDYSDAYGTASNELTGPINERIAASLNLKSAGRKLIDVVRDKNGEVQTELFSKHQPVDNGEYVDPSTVATTTKKVGNTKIVVPKFTKSGSVKRKPGPKIGSKNRPKSAPKTRLVQRVRTTSGNPLAKNFGGWGQLFQGDKTVKIGKPTRQVIPARKKALTAQANKILDLF